MASSSRHMSNPAFASGVKGPSPVAVCKNVAGDLGLGGGLCRAVRFPRPVAIWLKKWQKMKFKIPNFGVSGITMPRCRLVLSVLRLKPHSHIHDFSHDYADLANRPSYTFRVCYYANFAFFLFNRGLLFDYHTIYGDGVTTVVGHEYVRSRLIPHVVVVGKTVIRCS